jgi:hypothetical protein
MRRSFQNAARYDLNAWKIVRMRYGYQALFQKLIKRRRRVDESWERQTAPRVYIHTELRITLGVVPRRSSHSVSILLGLITSRGSGFKPPTRPGHAFLFGYTDTSAGTPRQVWRPGYGLYYVQLYTFWIHYYRYYVHTV